MKACKIILSLLLLHFALSVVFAGNPIELPGLKEPVFSSAATKSGFSQSILFAHVDSDYKSDKHPMAAWVLLGIGAGTLTTGTVLLSKGLNNMLNLPNNGDNSLLSRAAQGHDVVLISAGGALAFTGLVLTPTGLVMGAAGKVRYNKYTPPRPYLITPVCDSYGIGICACL
jgi:hypothetical protein